jgi:hypothetical protein
VAIYRLMDGQSGRPGVGSTGTQPPATGYGVTAGLSFGLRFRVEPMAWMQGYWWWVANTGQDTAPVKCCLWQVNGQGFYAPQVVPGSTVTSGTLTPGQWNWIPLAAPLALAPGGPYMATIGASWTAGVPRTASQFAPGQPYASGLSNGPLLAYDDGVTSPWTRPQMAYSTSGDPTAQMPDNDSGGNLYWVDVQVTDHLPPGGTYRVFPNVVLPWNGKPGQNTASISNQYVISASVTLSRLWHFSPPTATVLPSECGVWAETGQALVTGTHLTSPAWKNTSGAAASPAAGWIYVDYTSASVTLPAGRYRPATFYPADSSTTWFASTPDFFPATQASYVNFGVGGLTSGPIFVPDLSQAEAPGQGVYSGASTFSYPNSWDSTQDGEVHWIDIEVVPAGASGSGLLMAAGII